MDVILALVPPAIDAARVVAQEGTTISITDTGMKYLEHHAATSPGSSSWGSPLATA